MRYLAILFILAIIALPRLLFLPVSSHFRGDESRDLVNIHQIFVEHKITLVGPISDKNTYLYSSLTYYLLLPFAAIFNFRPISTIVGAVFYGIATAMVLAIIVGRTNRRLFWPGMLAIAFWFPLVETSRWPWNPNFVPLWITLGLLFSGYNRPFFQLLSGLSFGALIHHHYTAALTTLLAALKFRKILFIAGVILMIIPFIVFDFRHPPGIFLNSIIGYNSEAGRQIYLTQIPARLMSAFNYALGFIFPTGGLTKLFFIFPAIIIIYDIKKLKNLFFLLGWFLPILPLAIYRHEPQYLLASVPFFIIWLVQKRTKKLHAVQLITLILLTITSLVVLPKLILPQDVNDNPTAIWQISQVINREIKTQKLVNPNLAVLGSPDIYTSGKKYRDLLLISGTPVKIIEQLDLSDNLFVITTVANTDDLRKDPAAEMKNFRSGPIYGTWPIPDTNWKVVQFNRY